MGVEINGPKILFTINILGGINITESIVNQWVVIALITIGCIFLTRDLRVQNPGKRQMIAEKAVMFVRNLVKENMGPQWMNYTSFIATVLLFSAVSSMLSITGLRSPTADFSVTLAMALVTFTLIQYYNMKSKGFFGFFKRFFEPIFVMAPMNVIGEVATPMSMSLRHFGNIASGTVITALVYGALSALSAKLLGWIPNSFLSSIPILQVGVPAVLSLYFDLFSSCIQAYIFCMLTMANVASAAE